MTSDRSWSSSADSCDTTARGAWRSQPATISSPGAGRVVAQPVQPAGDAQEAPGLGVMGQQRRAEAVTQRLGGREIPRLSTGRLEQGFLIGLIDPYRCRSRPKSLLRKSTTRLAPAGGSRALTAFPRRRTPASSRSPARPRSREWLKTRPAPVLDALTRWLNEPHLFSGTAAECRASTEASAAAATPLPAPERLDDILDLQPDRITQPRDAVVGGSRGVEPPSPTLASVREGCLAPWWAPIGGSRESVKQTGRLGRCGQRGGLALTYVGNSTASAPTSHR